MKGFILMKKLLATTLKSILFFIIWIVMVAFVPEISIQSPAYWRLFYEFMPFLYIVILTLIFVILIEKRKLSTPIFSNILHNSLIGIITGIVWLGSTTLILYLLGVIHFVDINPISNLWIWILASLLNVIMQEFLVRGYLYQLLKKNYNIPAATLVTTALFTLLHGGAFEAGPISVFNVIAMSLFVTVLLEYTTTLLAPILVHFIWNTVGCIILGAVSLADDYPHLLNCDFSGNLILSGGNSKLEGSIVVLIINIALIGFFLTKHLLKNVDKQKKKTN